MKRIVAVVLLAILFSPVQAGTRLLECARLIDVDKGRVLENQQVLVGDNRIVAVGEQITVDPQVERIKLDTCLPGLMDMHVHLDGQLSRDGYIKRFQNNEADQALTAAYYANITLEAGFTTVRNLGDRYNVTVALRNAINAGRATGPRIYTAAKTIATTGGHGDPTNGFRHDMMGDPGPADGVINSPDEARKAVRQRYKDGADLIKVTATGGVLSLAKNGQNPQFTLDELEAVVLAANEYGMHVAAHAHGPEGMKRAVLAGVTSVEHGTFMDDEIIVLMKQQGTYYVPTISAGRFVAEKAEEEGYFPAQVRPKAAAVGPQIQSTFKKAYENGVTIAFGTDSGVGPHGTNALEFVYMVESGMSEMEAIQSATVTTSKLLGVEDELGSISEGKLADIVAVKGNPLDDIAFLSEMAFVMKDGVVYRND